MHDFCFTIPYGFAVLAGGVLGYLRRGSSASLAGGAGVGGLLLLAGVVSLKAFEKRRNSYLALAVETQFGIQDGRSFVGDGPGRYRGCEGAGRAINLGFV